MNIVVTGASSGIGFFTSLELSNQGHQVIAVSRNSEKLNYLKVESKKRNPDSKLSTITGDISSEDSVHKIVEEIKSRTSSVSVLINNAGKLISKPFADLTGKDWNELYSTNVFGTVTMIRDLLPLMGEGSHIVNISSIGGFQGSLKFKGLSGYSTSKAALVSLTECLAEEFKDRKIVVNCLCLGSVETEMFVSAFPLFKASHSAVEMAGFIAQFATEGMRFFNGKIIPVSNSTP